MTVQEAQKVIDELRATIKSKDGNSEKSEDEVNKEIAGSFYLLFADGKLPLEGLESLVNLLGFHLSDEFKQMDPEQQKTEGFEELSEQGGEEPTEEAPAEAPAEEESNEEDEEKQAMNLFNGGKKEESQEEDKDEADDDNDGDEDDEEKKKAMVLFGR